MGSLRLNNLILADRGELQQPSNGPFKDRPLDPQWPLINSDLGSKNEL